MRVWNAAYLFNHNREILSRTENDRNTGQKMREIQVESRKTKQKLL